MLVHVLCIRIWNVECLTVIASGVSVFCSRVGRFNGNGWVYNAHL